jgi:hypothetical protein
MSAPTSRSLLSNEVWRSLAGPRPRHLVVADANALFQDTLRRATDGFTAMTFLAEHGSIALLSPVHVPAKARERLPKMAADAGLSEAAVMETWSTVHEPLIRFVDVPASLCADDPRVVAVRDPEDVAFAQLAVAVGPSLLLTRDHHLHEAGIGTEQWVEALLILGSLIELELAFFGGTRLALAGGYVIASMTAEGVRLLCRSPVALGLALGAGVLVVGQDRQSLARRVTKGRRSLAVAGERLLDLAEPHLERRLKAREHLGTTLVAPMDPRPIDAICLREVALFPGGLETDDLSNAVRRGGHDLPRAGLEARLAAHPSFALEGERWSLGGVPSASVRQATKEGSATEILDIRPPVPASA